MIPEQKKLPSGATIELNVADFEASMTLLETVVAELKAVNIDLTVDMANIATSLTQEMPVGLIKNVLCQILGSKALKRDLAPCLGRCLYAGEAISRNTFEPANTRQDYFPAAWEVLKINLLPFFKGLDLKSLIVAAQKASSGPK